MLAATYTQGRGFEIREILSPRCAPDELLVRVQATAICGTDVKIIRHGSRRAAAGQRLVLGHEFAGTVQEVGAAVAGFTAGMRVGVAPNFGCGRCDACIRGKANLCADFSAFGIDRDGSHAPVVRIPGAAVAQGNVAELPASATWEEAALAEPLACVLNAQRGVNLAPGESVVVYGVGPMGLLHVILAAASGAGRIVAVDTNARRLAKALELGATLALDGGREAVPERLRAATGGRGADVVFTAVSVPGVIPEALSLLAPCGRLSLFAGLAQEQSAVALDANLIHYRNLTVTGTTGGANADYRAALQAIASRRVDVRPVISHRFPLAHLQAAYDVALSGQGLKVVLTAGDPA